jgi:polyhydroxybutyrate depolymerase
MAAFTSAGPRVLLAVALGALGGGCGDGAPTRAASGDTATVARAARACPSPGLTTLHGGFVRAPSGARPGTTPLIVLVVPGGRGDPADVIGFARRATRQGFAVLYPTRPGGGSWTLNREQGTSDVERVGDLLGRVVDTGCFDVRRISIAGVSNGAGFAVRMACELPARFAAVVAIAAGYRALDDCAQRARASFLAIHGSADTVVPYNGKRPDRAGSVPRYTARWAARDGCDPRPHAIRPRARVTRFAYDGCDAGRRVELLRLSGTDHGWPGAGPPLPQHNPSHVNATTELLRFVSGAQIA